MKNKSQLEKLYILLGASIFVHYVLVILVCLLILENMIRTGEYKKIVKDRLLILIEIFIALVLVTLFLFTVNFRFLKALI